MSRKRLHQLALDTTVAIYMLPGAKMDNDDKKRLLAQSLFSEMKFEFVLPAPVVSEILAPVPITKEKN